MDGRNFSTTSQRQAQRCRSDAVVDSDKTWREGFVAHRFLWQPEAGTVAVRARATTAEPRSKLS